MSDRAREHYRSVTPAGVSIPDILDGRPLQLLGSEDGTISPNRPDEQLVRRAQGRYGRVLAVAARYVGDVSHVKFPPVESVDIAGRNRTLGRNATHTHHMIQGFVDQKTVPARDIANFQTQAVAPEDLPDRLLTRFAGAISTYHANTDAKALFVTSADVLAGLYGKLSGRIACLSAVHMGPGDPVPRTGGFQLTQPEIRAISEILQPQNTLRSASEWEPMCPLLTLPPQEGTV